MERSDIKAKWAHLVPGAREQWSLLTGEDLDAVAGDRERLIALIQDRYGRSRAAAEREVDDWMERL